MADRQEAASRSKTEAKGRKKGKGRNRLGRVVDRSTETVERLHRAVAGWPLDALERVHRLEAPVARLRKLQERSITASYALVRGVNREVAQLARGARGARGASRAAPRRAGARRVAEAKPRRGARPDVVATVS